MKKVYKWTFSINGRGPARDFWGKFSFKSFAVSRENDAIVAIILITIYEPTGREYSCFEKGCLTYEENLNTTMSKVIMGNDDFTVPWLKLKVFQRVEGNNTNPCIHNFCCSPSYRSLFLL